MNQLQSRGESDSLLVRRFRDFTREKEKSGAEHLPPHREQVRAHLTDKREIAGDNLRHRVRHALELVADRKLNRLEGSSTRRCDVHSISVFGGGRPHFEAALAICFRRLLTSRKSISIANTL